MFWIVTWPISHRFRDKRRFPLKIANFSHPRVGLYIAPAGIGPLKALIRPCSSSYIMGLMLELGLRFELIES